eukprot:15347433-Ditylum_brightwellii.AAC.1
MEVGKKGTKESVFQCLYMAFTWNLMCHSDSTKRIKLCPLGAKAQYLLIFPAVLMNHIGLSFPGLDQGDRFLKGFETLLVENKEEICRM